MEIITQSKTVLGRVIRLLNKIVFILDAPKDLIRKLLVVDPKQRISIKDALSHPFFQAVVSNLVCVTLLYRVLSKYM